MPKLDKLQVSSRRTTWFQRKKKRKHDKSKHATDLRGVCLIHFNAYVHKCKLVQDLLEMETVVQLHNPSYSPDLSPCDFYVYFIEKKTIRPDVDISPQSAPGSAIVQCLQYVPNVYLSAFKACILRLETEFLSRENTSTG